MDELILKLIAAFGATLCFSVLFSVDRRQLIFCGLTGSTALLIYTGLKSITTDATAILATSLVIAILSRKLAIVRRSPVTVFLMPGIIPLAPGADLYNTMYGAVTGNSAAVSSYGYEALAAAGAVAIGIALAFSVPNRLFVQKIHKI